MNESRKVLLKSFYQRHNVLLVAKDLLKKVLVIYLEDGAFVAADDIVACARVGIDYAEEDAFVLLAFLFKGQCLSE